MSSKAAPAGSTSNKAAGGGAGKRAVKPTVALLESAESAAALTAAMAPMRSSKKAKPNKAPGWAGAAGTPSATGAAASASAGGAPFAEGRAEAEGAEAAADKQPKAKKSAGSSRKEAGAGAGGPSRPSASKDKDRKEDKKEEKDGAPSRAGHPTRPINFGKSYPNVDPLRLWEDEAALVGSMSIDDLVSVGSVVFESGVTRRSPYGFWQVDGPELERRVLALGLPFGHSRTATIWKLLSLGRLPAVASDTDATKWWGPFSAEDQQSLTRPEPDKLWYPEEEGWLTKNYSHAFLRLTTNKVAWAENRARAEQKVSVLSDIAAARALLEQTSSGMTGELRQMLDRQRMLNSGYSGGGGDGGGSSSSSSSSAKDSEAALPQQALLVLQQQVQQQVQQAGGTGVGFGGLPVALDSEQLQHLLARNQGAQPGLPEKASKTSPAPDGGASVRSPTASAAVAATTGAGMQSDVGFMLWVRRCRAEEVGTVLRAVKLATDGIRDKSELLAKNSAIEQEVDKFYKTLELEWHSLPEAARTMYRLQGELAARERPPQPPDAPSAVEASLMSLSEPN
jgi:hypothetical protein